MAANASSATAPATAAIGVMNPAGACGATAAAIRWATDPRTGGPAAARNAASSSQSSSRIVANRSVSPP